MGKNLKGKECGRGIGQKKNGLFYARYIDGLGVRHERLFRTVSEARSWQTGEVANRGIFTPTMMTVDDWFEFWEKNLINDRAPNTIRNYRERYEKNIRPIIGAMRLSDVKPMHCKLIFNTMDPVYSGGTERQTYITLGTLLKSALDNDLIAKHPCVNIKFGKPVRAVDDIRFLTVEEQRIFLERARRSHNYWQYALILETGLRTGEIIGLTWDAIDISNRTLTVNKQLEYRFSSKIWRASSPKTKHSYRTLPLTQRAVDILQEVARTVKTRKTSPNLQTLVYTDILTGDEHELDMRDLVFLNWRTGMPNKNSSYDTHLYKLCDEAGIERFSMHALRHTYATRAIEAGMQPKVLQRLLGHASIKTTMDRYVHVTDDSLRVGVDIFEKGAKKVQEFKIDPASH